MASNTGTFVGTFGFKIQIVLEVRLFLSTPVISLEVINLNLSNIFMSMVAGINRKFSKLYFILPLVPVYWMLHSYAAFIGLFEVITKPHYWAKTTHGKYLT